MQIVQCISVGLPRAGKTSLYHRLLDRRPPGQPTQRNILGKGSDSTNVMTERKMLQVKIDDDDHVSTSKAFFGDQNCWSESTSLNDEIMIYLKAVYEQQKSEMTSSSIQLDPPTTSTTSTSTSDDNPSYDNPATSKSTSHIATPTTSQTTTSTTVDMTVFDGIMRRIKNRSGDLVQLQALLDKLLTIFYTDCGGQDEFAEILPALMSGPSIFMLIFNLCESLDNVYNVRYDSSVHGSVEYPSASSVKDILMRFLSSIQSFHEGQTQRFETSKKQFASDVSASFCSPPTKVIGIGTHRDLVDDSVIKKADQSLQDCIKDTKFEVKG